MSKKPTKSKKSKDEERKPPAPLPTLPPSERGPAGMKASSATERSADDVEEPTPPSDNILDYIRGRFIKPAPFAEQVLTLEIIRGEYTGIVFTFKTFEVMNTPLENGMVPTKYETKLWHVPERFGKGWTQTEAFDRFTSEVLFAWLTYVQHNSLAPLLKSAPLGGIQ